MSMAKAVDRYNVLENTLNQVSPAPEQLVAAALFFSFATQSADPQRDVPVEAGEGPAGFPVWMEHQLPQGCRLLRARENRHFPFNS